MGRWKFAFDSQSGWLAVCAGREPFKPRYGALPWIVYFPSRYRGMCVGTLVSRVAVLTAAVCVTSPTSEIHDRRPINIITGSTYRHPRRGVRVQVTKILIPRLNNITGNRGYLMEKSAAILLLKRKVPDAMVGIPQRAIPIDWKGDEVLTLQEECFMPGWHFFYRGDRIYPIHRFLLQRNVRVQFMNIVKKNMWCEALSIKFQKALANMGFFGYFDKGGCICVKDPDRTAQPCHGMYGAPLVCRAKVVALMMAPDAQWTNCTGFSNLLHTLSGNWLRSFMSCVSVLFEPDIKMDWRAMKKNLWEDPDHEQYDYVPALYDKMNFHAGSTSTESEEN
ncbi:hypothetical protein ABMA28_000014 [Loxostege sticticalis]|uniref:Peptidase S1 domain-containing protein n=1 Tax=Loxostege sticticalis TaxID=481309 RepID=A0ABD0TQQ0_LOXSC